MKAQKLKTMRVNLFSILPLLILSVGFVLAISITNQSPNNLKVCDSNTHICQNDKIRLATATVNGCGAGTGWVATSIDFGCNGNSCNGSQLIPNPPYCNNNHNGITDLIFAIIRFLSDGVGLIVIASIIIGGIQYITSRGDPNATQAAVKRITSSILAFIIFIFGYAILNYIIPGTFLK